MTIPRPRSADLPRLELPPAESAVDQSLERFGPEIARVAAERLMRNAQAAEPEVEGALTRMIERFGCRFVRSPSKTSSGVLSRNPFDNASATRACRPRRRAL